MSESANDGLPAFVPGRIVRIPLNDLHEFLTVNELEIVGALAAAGDQHRLVVELAPIAAQRSSLTTDD